ncbi:YbaY family lipoprotein [Polaromonas sp. P1-6]|nr:YbaY family lipoprotein [Polaromonas sp. P1-6]
MRQRPGLPVTARDIGRNGRTRGTGRLFRGRVSGNISYLQRIALPPDSDVIVQLLQDVSRMDAKADILAEQRFTTSSQVPLPFELLVDPAKINPRMRYAVAARIERGGKLMFINDKLYPVLTQGHGSRVDLILHMVARP